MQELARTAGLLGISEAAARLDHPFLRQALAAVVDGTEPVEVVAAGLEEAGRQPGPGEKERALFLAFSCLLLQTAASDLEGELLRARMGWDPFALETLPHQALRRGDIEAAWQGLRRGAVFHAGWERLLAEPASRPMAVLCAHRIACQEYLRSWPRSGGRWRLPV